MKLERDLETKDMDGLVIYTTTVIVDAECDGKEENSWVNGGIRVETSDVNGPLPLTLEASGLSYWGMEAFSSCCNEMIYGRETSLCEQTDCDIHKAVLEMIHEIRTAQVV